MFEAQVFVQILFITQQWTIQTWSLLFLYHLTSLYIYYCVFFIKKSLWIIEHLNNFLIEYVYRKYVAICA